jgi:hypothetical protein
MENKDIINFSKFFGDKPTQKLSTFKKEDFEDFFVNEEVEEEDDKKSDVKDIPEFDPPVDIEQFVIEDEEPEEIEFEDSLGSYENDSNFTDVKENTENYFAVYKDKIESFSCDVSNGFCTNIDFTLSHNIFTLSIKLLTVIISFPVYVFNPMIINVFNFCVISSNFVHSFFNRSFINVKL